MLMEGRIRTGDRAINDSIDPARDFVIPLRLCLFQPFDFAVRDGLHVSMSKNRVGNTRGDLDLIPCCPSIDRQQKRGKGRCHDLPTNRVPHKHG